MNAIKGVIIRDRRRHASYLPEVRHSSQRWPVTGIHDKAGAGFVETIVSSSHATNGGQSGLSDILEANHKPTFRPCAGRTAGRRIRRRGTSSDHLELDPPVSAT